MPTTERTSYSDAVWMINYITWLEHLAFTCKTVFVEHTLMYRQANINWCATAGAVYQPPDGSRLAWDEWYGYIKWGMLQLWKVQLLMNGRQRVGMEELIYSLEIITHATYSLGIPCMSCVYHTHAF